MVESGNLQKELLSFSPYLLLLIVFSAAGAYVQLPFFAIIKYLFIQVLMLVTGLAVLQASDFRAKDRLQRLFFSYALGYCTYILIYLILLMTGIQRFVGVPTVISGLTALVYLVLHRKRYAEYASEGHRKSAGKIPLTELLLGALDGQSHSLLLVRGKAAPWEGDKVHRFMEEVFPRL